MAKKLTAATRLTNEAKNLPLATTEEVAAEWGIGGGPRGDNLFVWDAFILGPEGTPWEGGRFKLTISFPLDYPLSPMVLKFQDRIFHPNFYPNGCICLDLFEGDWNPAYSTQKLLLAIRALLDCPNLESPVNPEAARLYSMNRDEYNSIVRATIAASSASSIPPSSSQPSSSQ